MGRLSARLRSILTLGFADRIAETHARLARIEADIVTLRTVVRTRDERAQQRLKSAMSSLANLVSILPEMNIKGVIPPFPHQGFTITGEEAAFFFHLIRRHRPRLIFELGSGSSTVLFAAALRANGNGRVISVEHDGDHVERTRTMLKHADLSDRVELVHAPLSDLALNGRAFRWYDLGLKLSGLTEKIDFLFVDGPPGKVQALSRFPALPILASHLSPRAIVVVDDGAREDELKMVGMWGEMDGAGFETETLDFLPHSPMLLTMGGSEGRIAELRRARDEDKEDEVGLFGQGRRSGTS